MTPAEIDQKIKEHQSLVYSCFRDIHRLNNEVANHIREIQRLEELRDDKSRFQIKLINLEAQASASYHGGRIDIDSLKVVPP